jgi:hypothetical protein
MNMLDWISRQKHKDAMHLGDGLYASHDWYYIWLSAERFPEVHYVGLEPDVFRSLLGYVKRIESELDGAGFWTGNAPMED